MLFINQDELRSIWGGGNTNTRMSGGHGSSKETDPSVTELEKAYVERNISIPRETRVCGGSAHIFKQLVP